MKKYLTVLIVFIPIVYSSCQTNNNYMLFKTNDIEIKFPGSYVEMGKGAFYSVTNLDYVKGYFFTFEKEIHFCEDHAQKFETVDDGDIIELQTVETSDGYLCSMYVLPLISEQDLIVEIRAFEPKGALATFKGPSKVTIGDYEVIKWFARNGKTRLYHYMLKAKNHYYLFVSSPYGDEEYIEELIAEAKLLK